MTEEEQEEYLRKNEWRKSTQTLWFHKDCNYNCCLEVALEVQQLRDNKKSQFKKIVEKVMNKFSGALEKLK